MISDVSSCLQGAFKVSEFENESATHRRVARKGFCKWALRIIRTYQIRRDLQ